jgi:hypothetical protein
MTSDKTVDNKTGTTSISFGETLLGGNLCCFYYLGVVKRNHLDPRQCPIRTARSLRRKPRCLSALKLRPTGRVAAALPRWEDCEPFQRRPNFAMAAVLIAAARPARMRQNLFLDDDVRSDRVSRAGPRLRRTHSLWRPEQELSAGSPLRRETPAAVPRRYRRGRRST